MGEVLLNWIWICMHCLICGILILQIISKISGYYKVSLDLVFASGLTFLAVYAQFFSIFYRVSTAAVVILILLEICGVTAGYIYYKKCGLSYNFINYVKVNFTDGTACLTMKLLIAAGLFLVLAAISSGVPDFYDTNLYHAESIRMIEEYGIIKGAGNLHSRLAYNSSLFALQALFSMVSILGRSLHTLNGLITWFVLTYAVCSMNIWNRKITFSDVLRIVLIYMNTSWIVWNSLPSMQSDTFMNNLAVYIIVRWGSLIDEEENSYVPYAMLSIFAAFNLTIKLSTVLLILLAIKPAITLIIKKDYKGLGACIVVGFLVLCPFVIRNIILSGYVLYPFPELDVLDVPWKIPAEYARGDAQSITNWARALYVGGLSLDGNYSIKEWFPYYWSDQFSVDKIILIMDFVLIPVCILRTICLAIRKNWDKVVLYFTIIMCFAAWFVQGPATRFGKVWMLYMIAIPVAELLVWVMGKVKLSENLLLWGQRCVVGLICLILIKPVVFHARNNTNWVHQADYEVLQCESCEIDGVDVYYPIEGDRAGYYNFPSSPGMPNGLGLYEYGNIKSGFYNEQ